MLKETFLAYKKNFRQVLLFSLPFLITFIIPIIVKLPTFLALGGIFLRSGGIFLTLTLQDAVYIAIPILLSLLFLSFGVVAMNLIIKAQKTLTKTKASVISEISLYVLEVFIFYLGAIFFYALVTIFGYIYNVPQVFGYVLIFVFSALTFYIPPAVVIDELSLKKALFASLKRIKKAPGYFVLWLIIGGALVSVVSLASLAFEGFVFDVPLSEFVSLLLNSFIVAPLLTIMQTEAYIRKYPMLKR